MPNRALFSTDVSGTPHFGGRDEQAIAVERSGAKAAQRGRAAEQQPLVVGKARRRGRVLGADRADGLAEESRRSRARPWSRGRCAPARCGRAGRSIPCRDRRRCAGSSDRRACRSPRPAPNVQSSSLTSPKSTELREAKMPPFSTARDAALGATGDLDAAIVDLEARVLALPDADARFDAGERPALEGAIGFERGAPRAAPRQRHRQPLAAAEQCRSCSCARHRSARSRRRNSRSAGTSAGPRPVRAAARAAGSPRPRRWSPASRARSRGSRRRSRRSASDNASAPRPSRTCRSASAAPRRPSASPPSTGLPDAQTRQG